MYISKFSRIDTVTWPGKYLSVVCLSEEGPGENIAEVANTIRNDKDSIDAVLLMKDDGDAESIPNIHAFLKQFRTPMVPTVLITSGFDTSALSDIVGARYVDRVAFRLDGVPGAEQTRSIEMMRSYDVPFVICPVLNPNRITSEEVIEIAKRTPGHKEFILIMPRDPSPCFKKKDANALAKSLKGIAKNVRILNDLRMP